jgi:hypothetical protein
MQSRILELTEDEEKTRGCDQWPKSCQIGAQHLFVLNLSCPWRPLPTEPKEWAASLSAPPWSAFAEINAPAFQNYANFGHW